MAVPTFHEKDDSVPQPAIAATVHRTRFTEFVAGARDTLPLIVGAAPFGVIFGALAATSGLSLWAGPGMSLMVFAGSAQFVAVGMVAQGVSVPLIVLATFVVNLRHALYAMSLGPYLKRLPQRWLLPLGFWLTDETYAVSIRRYAAGDASPYGHWYVLGSALAMYANWQLCTFIGVAVGTRVADPASWGLDFATVVTFIGIIVPLIRSRPMLVCALAASASAVMLQSLPNRLGLIVAAIIGIAAGVLSERWLLVPVTDGQSTWEGTP